MLPHNVKSFSLNQIPKEKNRYSRGKWYLVYLDERRQQRVLMAAAAKRTNQE